MRMDLLIRHLQPVSHPVKVVNIDQPYPGDVPLLGHACCPVPLRHFPQLVGLFQTAARKCLVHIFIHCRVGIGRIFRRIRPFYGMVDIIQLHRSMSAPAPEQWVRQRPVIGGVPSHTLQSAGDSQLFHLCCKIRSQGLTHGVTGRIQQVQFRFHSVLFSYAVLPQGPSRLVKQGCRPLRIILNLRCLIIPGELVADTVGRTSVSVQHIVDHLLPVHTDIDRAAHQHV